MAVIASALSVWFFPPLGQKVTEQAPLEENRGDPYLHVGSKHVPVEAIQVFSEHGISLELTTEEKENLTSLEDFFIMGSNIPENMETFARDPNEYSLMITGEVEENASLSYEELLERFEMKQIITELYCMPSLTGVGKFVGPSIYDVISYARPKVQATKVIIVAGDGYEREFLLEEIKEHREDYILAMAMNGYPLAIEHGYPVRLALTGEQGSSWVKWIVKIVVEPASLSDSAMPDLRSTRYPCGPIVKGILTDSEVLGANPLSANSSPARSLSLKTNSLFLYADSSIRLETLGKAAPSSRLYRDGFRSANVQISLFCNLGISHTTIAMRAVFNQ